MTIIKRTISAMSGDGVVAHNRRTYFAENVDQTRTNLNIEYGYTPIEDVYHQLFDEAQVEYNAKQKRKDHRIENYYEKICKGDQEKPFYEVLFQVGNKDDMAAAKASWQRRFWTITAFWNATPIFMYIPLICTWMKPRPICILILFPLPHGANEDYPPVFR
ncbi:BC10 family protein [[Clostridium] innocuum]|nr:BC10 family protein [[Clostridium] innocuum]